ncbi:hypothetical protein [Pseudomonas sp.]|jgi:hypothetical protein|uniref:hypothetical protein n=1 Tax=Pseudomonas sp. TaxID=306 RepID=UPI003FD8CDFE
MKTIGRVYPAGETALLLRQALGNMRSWDDALADMRTGKTQVYGFILKPIGKIYHERVKRPVYAWEHIKDFILKITAISENAKFKQPPQGIVAEYDDATHWRHQVITAR